MLGKVTKALQGKLGKGPQFFFLPSRLEETALLNSGLYRVALLALGGTIGKTSLGRGSWRLAARRWSNERLGGKAQGRASRSPRGHRGWDRPRG